MSTEEKGKKNKNDSNNKEKSKIWKWLAKDTIAEPWATPEELKKKIREQILSKKIN